MKAPRGASYDVRTKVNKIERDCWPPARQAARVLPPSAIGRSPVLSLDLINGLISSVLAQGSAQWNALGAAPRKTSGARSIERALLHTLHETRGTSSARPHFQCVPSARVSRPLLVIFRHLGRRSSFRFDSGRAPFVSAVRFLLSWSLKHPLYLQPGTLAPRARFTDSRAIITYFMAFLTACRLSLESSTIPACD